MNAQSLNAQSRLKLLSTLSDEQVEADTDLAVARESSATASILLNIVEINRRMLFAKRGCDSLFSYVREKFKYSEPQAQRRVTAAALVHLFPELADKIESRSFNLSLLCLAQGYFNKEKAAKRALSNNQKKEILNSIEGKSVSAAEKILASTLKDANKKPKEGIRRISENLSIVTFYVTDEERGLIERYREILPGSTLSQIVNDSLRSSLSKKDPMTHAQRRTAKREKKKARETAEAQAANRAETNELAQPSKRSDSTSQQASIAKVESPINTKSQNDSNTCKDFTPQKNAFGEANSPVQASPQQEAKRSRYITAQVKDEVRLRDSDRCTYEDPLSGKRCDSRQGLEFDHVEPYCHGGANTSDNLRLRCFSHNKLYAIEKLGREHMDAFYRTNSI